MTDQTQEKRNEMTHSPGFVHKTQARLVLFWEKAWPALLPMIAPLGFLVIMSLFDLWRFIPAWLHWGFLATIFATTAYAIYRFRTEFVWPSKRDVLRRFEEDGKLAHAPLQALQDTPLQHTSPQQSLTQQILWEQHQNNMAKAAKGARVNAPYATADKRDPFSLRYLMAGLVILGLFIAGGEWPLRLGAAFNPTLAREEIANKADMWIEPPSYTGIAPIYLVRATGELPELADQINVPRGSTIIAQINGERGVSLIYTNGEGERQEAVKATDEQNNRTTATRLELPITQNGLIQLRLGARRGLWPVLALEDSPPLVNFIGEQEITKSKELSLHYSFEDDYGATLAHLSYRLDPDQDRPLDAPAYDEGALKTVRLTELDGAAGAAGERRHTVPLEDDPWAGLDVYAKIIVTDGAEQKGESEEIKITLPAREFFNPLAKAVIEQRQDIAVASDEIQRVRDALNAITLLPEEFYDDTSEYLLLRTAFWRAQRNQKDQTTDVIDHFWPLALQLEDKALELARRRLDAAIEALRQALEQNASQEVVSQRKAELEQAIQDYIQALAQAGIPEGGGGEDGGQLGANTLQEMLDSIGDLSESGANNAARQLLSDLENILDNLQLSRGSGGEGGVPSEGGEPSDEPSDQAGELIGRQRDLSNRSFEEGQQQDGSGDQLAQEQQDLAGAAQDLLDSITNGGQNSGGESGEQQGGQQGGGGNPDPTGEAGQALREAIREMQRAQQALEGDDFGTAGTAMDRAISNLREGAQKLAEEQSRQEQARGEEGNQAGEGGGDGEGLDPSGRPTGGRADGGGGEVPDGADPAVTRELIEKLRKRLGEQGRSEEEIEYLERLLEAF